MTPELFHDSIKVYTAGLCGMVAFGALAVLGMLVWSESNSGARPQGCRVAKKASEAARS